MIFYIKFYILKFIRQILNLNISILFILEVLLPICCFTFISQYIINND